MFQDGVGSVILTTFPSEIQNLGTGLYSANNLGDQIARIFNISVYQDPITLNKAPSQIFSNVRLQPFLETGLLPMQVQGARRLQ